MLVFGLSVFIFLFSVCFMLVFGLSVFLTVFPPNVRCYFLVSLLLYIIFYTSFWFLCLYFSFFRKCCFFVFSFLFELLILFLPIFFVLPISLSFLSVCNACFLYRPIFLSFFPKARLFWSSLSPFHFSL